MNTSLLIELFLYFAKFPANEAFVPLFNKGRSQIPGYDELHTALLTLPAEGLVPEIGNYVFGPNFEAVCSRIII